MPIKPTHLLAGDIGGTKANIAIFAINGDHLVVERGERYPSAEFAGLNVILREFLKAGPSVPLLAAGFGVPGVVKEGHAKPTNLHWKIDAKAISKEFGIPHVGLLNDLAANAYGISQLQPKDFATLQEGAAGATGNRCVISPGTGLGQAGLFWDGHHHRVWASEGGHSDFAPRDELEIALLQYLIARYGHVSSERVVSGMGIENIYEFLRDTGRGLESPEVVDAMRTESSGEVITHFADSEKCPLCVQTLEIFLGCFGAEAGNVALKAMAVGGVFLGGGIPAKMLTRLQGPGFLKAFHDKGRLTSLMQSMPVKVVLNDGAALLGAARYALDLPTYEPLHH
ncbi:MAG: glucokinase [Terrimicrobiaceae bacterium]